MTSIINILMIIGMIIGVFKAKLPIIVSILCFITSIFCFCQSFKKLGNSKTSSERQKAMNNVVIDGISIPIIFIVTCLNIAIYNLKLLIIFLILNMVFSFTIKVIKSSKK